MHDIIIAIVSVAGTAGISWVIARVSRGTGLARIVQEMEARQSKRTDRLEEIVPPLARGMLVMLKIHTGQETNGDVKDSLDELQKLATDMMVSRKKTP
jgi:reverse gyrase